MNKILFRTDGNSNMGTGHLMRCLALAQALKKQHVSSTFVVSNEAAAICHSRQDWEGEVIVLPANIGKHDEASWLAELCQQTQVDALILDGYQFDASYRKSVSAFTGCLVLFDDNNDSGDLHADVIINGADNANELGYRQTAPVAKLCLGSQYRVMRKEFVDLEPPVWAERQALGIIMGGSDPLNLSLPLLDALENQVQLCLLPKIKLLTGPAYPHIEQLNEFLSHTSLTIEHCANCQQVAEVFAQCKLVVSAAGSSQFELLACQTPSILLVVADNQLNASQQASTQGWCLMFDARNRLDFSAIARQTLALYRNEPELQKMYQLCEQYKDAEGGQRVVEAMVQHCKDK